MSAVETMVALGGQVTAQEGAATGWPTDATRAAAGELWVSKDLQAIYHPASDWIDGRDGRRPIYARDLTSGEGAGDSRRCRTYRLLDCTWYAWLHRSVARMQASGYPDQHPAAWAIISARMNALWSLARQWWGAERLAELSDPHYLSADYRPPQPDPDIYRRWSN